MSRAYGVAALAGVSRRLRTTFDFVEIATRVVSDLAALMAADRCMLMLDRGARAMEVVASSGPALAGQSGIDPSEALLRAVELVRRHPRPLLVEDLASDPRFAGASGTGGLGPRSAMCVPLLGGSRLLGVICAEANSGRAPFDAGDLAFLEAAGEVAALALSHARSHARFVEAASLSESFLLDLDPASVLDRALSRMVDVTHASTGALLLREGSTASPAVVATRRREDHGPASDVSGRISAHVIQRVLESGRPLLTDNATLDPDESLAYSAKTKQLLSILCVPIRAWGESRGAVYLENAAAEGVFDEEDARLALVVADQAGMALENARLHGVERATITALANAIEARDSGTSSHVQRVTRLAVAVGRRLGLTDKQLVDLERAAILHDVGKIGVPDAVLLKPGRLDAAEVAVMRKHPDLGSEIVAPIGLSPAALDGIRAHQEQWNGSGYPRGLSGADIPLFGRILAVVDTYDAMVSDRPYRRGCPPEQALAEIRRCAGTQFDPAVAAAFLAIQEELGVRSPES